MIHHLEYSFRWRRRKRRMATELPELEEIFIGGLSLLTSPKLIASLDARRKKNEQLDKLLRKFQNPRRRAAMFKEGWRWLDSQIEHRLKHKGAPFIAIFGDRGIGKSEAEATLLFRLTEAYWKFLGIEAVPGLGRNPSDINSILAQATKEGVVVIVLGDETEEETGQGKVTEERALIDNLETIRVLLHTVIRCANRYAKLRMFSYYCDFVLEVIFQDIENLVNYAILYVVDEDIGSDPRIPMYIINLPLHENEWFREFYEARKQKDQTEFTESGGRRSRVRKKLMPYVDRLVQYCVDNSLMVGRGNDIQKPDDLLNKLIFRVRVGKAYGDKWNISEQRLICQEAFDQLTDWQRGKLDKESDHLFKDYMWESDFSWRDKIARMMQDHPEWSHYHPYFIAAEVELLNVYKHEKQFNEITGTKKTTNRKWVVRMRTDERFNGWLKDRRAALHESYLASKFKDAGWHVEEKPRFIFADLDYEEDLLIAKDGREVWINAKCGSGSRTYVKDEYKTTYILANAMRKETYILYLDLETNIHEVHMPGESFVVGSGRSTAEIAVSAIPSTPFLLLEAVAAEGPKAAVGPEEDGSGE